tara:strand:- start:221 stop:649 length:429 start_codon:yes stop_codon:yes gene_type:complete
MAYKMKRGAAPKFKELGSSPVKQDYHEALDHWKGYKAGFNPQPRANTKMAIDFNLENKKAQNQKLAAGKKSTSTLDRVTKAFKNTPEQLAKRGKQIIKKLGGKTLGVAGMLGATSATATQPGTGTHGGKKVKKYNPKSGKYE